MHKCKPGWLWRRNDNLTCQAEVVVVEIQLLFEIKICPY
jgi:hypothetical protein